jgi:hypothetical protein
MAVAATTASRAETTPIVEAIVGTEDPGMRARTSATFTASPPRAGVKELIATPAAYAPAIPSSGTRLSGYAARSTLRHPAERKPKFARWNAIATRMSCGSTRARLSSAVPSVDKR